MDYTSFFQSEESIVCMGIEKPAFLAFHSDQEFSFHYYCIFPEATAFHEALRAKCSAIDPCYDFSNDAEGLEQQFASITKLLSGETSLCYYDSKWPVTLDLIKKETRKNEEAQLQESYDAYLKKYAVSDEAMSILHYHTAWREDEGQLKLGTIVEADLDEDRVAYWKERIAKGDRPWVLCLDKESDTFDEMLSLVLVGHHRLRAYQELNIPAKLIDIDWKAEDQGIDLEAICNKVYRWQFDFLFQLWNYGKKDYVKKVMQKPDSPLHQYVPHGDVTEHYANGQLKRTGKFAYGEAEGCIKEWYEDGILKAERHYVKGKPVGAWKKYYPVGSLREECFYDEQSRYHGDVFHYYEDQEKRSHMRYVHGQLKENYWHKAWFENGKIQLESLYGPGNQLVETKEWNTLGYQIRHSRYDPEKNVFENLAVNNSKKFRESMDYKLPLTKKEILKKIVRYIFIVLGILLMLSKLIRFFED